MHAIVIDHGTGSRLRWGVAPIPRLRAEQALVRVEAVSVNPGESASGFRGAAEGSVPGWEAAGIIHTAAADGSGPPVGAHVTTFDYGGGWAQFRAVDTHSIGVVPDHLSLDVAATLPVGAVSALRAVRSLGGVIGTGIMVTGASGSVGRFAVQLAHIAGATVTAVARDRARHHELRDLGAIDVVERPELSGRVDHVIETVGGGVLATAFQRMNAGGTLVSVGRSSGEPTIFTADDLLGDNGRSHISLRTFFMPDESGPLAQDLTWLAAIAGDGRLRPDAHETVDASELPDRIAAGGFRTLVARLP